MLGNPPLMLAVSAPRQLGASYKVKVSIGQYLRKLTGYYNYYAVTGNSYAVGIFWNEARWLIYKWLRRSGRRSWLTWSKYLNQLNRYGIRYPRVKDWKIGRVVMVLRLILIK